MWAWHFRSIPFPCSMNHNPRRREHNPRRWKWEVDSIVFLSVHVIEHEYVCARDCTLVTYIPHMWYKQMHLYLIIKKWTLGSETSEDNIDKVIPLQQFKPIYFTCVLSAYMYVHRVSTKVRGECWIPWNERYKRSWDRYPVVVGSGTWVLCRNNCS